jgi:hypothetical protein
LEIDDDCGWNASSPNYVRTLIMSSLK